MLNILLIFSVCGCNQQEISVGKELISKQKASLFIESHTLFSDSVQYYFEQARLGIGDAYVRMAQFYLDGTLGAQPSKGGNNGLYGRGIYGDS